MVELSAQESLAVGDDSPRRRRWQWAVPVLAIGVLLAGADQLAQSRAWGQIGAARTEVAAAATAAEASVAGMRAYAGPSLTSPEVDPAVRADLRALIRSEAERGAGRVEAAVSERPWAAAWHPEIDAEWRRVRGEAMVLTAQLREAVGP